MQATSGLESPYAPLSDAVSLSDRGGSTLTTGEYGGFTTSICAPQQIGELEVVPPGHDDFNAHGEGARHFEAIVQRIDGIYGAGRFERTAIYKFKTYARR